MQASSILLGGRPVALAGRIGRRQRWRVNHFPHRLNRHYALEENLRYAALIDDLNTRFGLIGEAPQIQISNEGAFITMRHFVDEPLKIAIQVSRTSPAEGEANISDCFLSSQKYFKARFGDLKTTAKPSLAMKLEILETDGRKMEALRGVTRTSGEKERREDLARLERDRLTVLEVLKRWADSRPRPPFPVLDNFSKWQHFYDKPLVPYSKPANKDNTK